MNGMPNFGTALAKKTKPHTHAWTKRTNRTTKINKLRITRIERMASAYNCNELNEWGCQPVGPRLGVADTSFKQQEQLFYFLLCCFSCLSLFLLFERVRRTLVFRLFVRGGLILGCTHGSHGESEVAVAAPGPWIWTVEVDVLACIALVGID